MILAGLRRRGPEGRGRALHLLAAVLLASLGAIVAFLAWLVIGHDRGWSRGDVSALVGAAAAVGGAIGGPFATPLFEGWLDRRSALDRAGAEAYRVATINAEREEAGPRGRSLTGISGVVPEAELLVEAMHAYVDGYLALCGELSGFDVRWSDDERTKALNSYHAWIDARGISRALRTTYEAVEVSWLRLGAFGNRDGQERSLSDLRNASCDFLTDTVECLLGAKKDFDVRRDLNAHCGSRAHSRRQRRWLRGLSMRLR